MQSAQDIVFGTFRLSEQRKELTRDGVAVPLGSRALDILLFLVRHAGSTVGKDTLMAAIWPDRVVEENNLTVHMSALRRALGGGAEGARHIRTEPGRGYRFIAHIEEPMSDATPASAAALPAAMQQQQKPSVAVLPFDNLSADLDQEHFADGVVEDITTELSRSRSLFVVARNSSFTYRGRSVDIRQVASELGVRYVLEGSVRRSAERVRVTAQLIEAESGSHVWAERYDREVGDVFTIQDEITRAVTTAIGSAVSDAEMDRAMHRSPEFPGAWALYQQGMWRLAKLDAAENDTACRLFERAVELNPIFAPAHIGLTYCYTWAGGLYMNRPVEDARRLASIHARKAVELDPSDADALAGLAWTRMFYGEMDSVLGLSRQALSINPNCARAHAILGLGLIFTGRMSEGREEIAIFERLAPRDPIIKIARRQIVVSHYFDREYQRCVEVARRLSSADADLPLNYRWMAAALGQLGRTEEARAALERSLTVSPREYDVYVRNRIPWMRPEDYEHMLDGMRKAGWQA